LHAFYDDHFKTVLEHDGKLDLRNLPHSIHYLAEQMHTAIHNNLKEHFIKRLLRFVNLTTTQYEDGLTKEEAKAERRGLKDALFANDGARVPGRYTAWYKEHRPRCLPSTWAESLPYDVQANSSRYLVHSLYMNKRLEEGGFKLFQPLSLRTRIVPHYAPFDTASLISLFAEQGESSLVRHIEENQRPFWDRLFKLDKWVFRSRKTRYRFNYTMQTDGVGVSLTFVHKDHDRKKMKGCRCAGCCAEREGEGGYASVDQLTDSDIETIKGRNIVGCDPGKFSLVYMSDDKSKLRYNARQRRTETKLTKNSKILLTEKEKHGVHEVEATLLEHNARTVDVERFKDYLRQKNLANARLRSFYHRTCIEK